MMFGMDWPGVFIRGDNAFGYAQALHRFLEGGLEEGCENDNVRDTLWGLVALLVSCQVGLPLNTHPMKTQGMLRYEESRCGKKPAAHANWTEEGMRLREHIKELTEAWRRKPSKISMAKYGPPLDSDWDDLPSLLADLERFMREHPGYQVLVADDPHIGRVGWSAFRDEDQNCHHWTITVGNLARSLEGTEGMEAFFSSQEGRKRHLQELRRKHHG